MTEPRRTFDVGVFWSAVWSAVVCLSAVAVAMWLLAGR